MAGLFDLRDAFADQYQQAKARIETGEAVTQADLARLWRAMFELTVAVENHMHSRTPGLLPGFPVRAQGEPPDIWRRNDSEEGERHGG